MLEKLYGPVDAVDGDFAGEDLGRHVTFDLPGGGTGSGTAIDVDADGQLIVRTDSGEEKVFTGEVSVHGIYGAV